MEDLINAFGLDTRLVAIQILNFAVLAGALWYFLYTPVLKLLDDRKKTIDEGLQDAEDAKALKENAEAERISLLTKAQKEAEVVAEKAKAHAAEKSVELVGVAEAKAQALIVDAEKKGVEIKAKAEKESEAEIAKLAVLAAERVLAEK
ncbi:ATP synthase F0 subunit B [Candidatus Parcubacteria bacterium]|uniref:ATP synthase subunit b n=1 Tax=Candidatus Kaiserbacteria bacterium CG10_big_fil_rev_8_21_14_0_10_47_16 TaxID=1974608 RepID=A0A2H0UDF7_9BACT|nr:ATP synthase F0 subunit B [Candidatus Parcubacteria bacterium]PIR84454.1 MAG: hypothetical protein COU16_02635 [Candidatus Kaiserbacteria bacterium CG10_big_fil_rev_8_21_14_0_10_47_16]